MLSIFSCVCYPSICLLWRNVCLVLWPIFFWLGHLFFWKWAAGVACIFFRLVVCQLLHLAIIFSHSEGCLFTILIVSFVVQKLLSLIRSHLFIFAFISNILGGLCLFLKLKLALRFLSYLLFEKWYLSWKYLVLNLLTR